ncbi:hypothetical protein [Streptomyces atratus]|uniref:hypothetical protein n=1 Tax=Streptomyces atratus TaxID=1893 RepID=UPI002B1DD422|nr:hypothetical protein [Streptomyces atratus]
MPAALSGRDVTSGSSPSAAARPAGLEPAPGSTRSSARWAPGGLEVLEVEEEFVVHDDHPAVDAGWIDERAGAPV